MSNETFKPTGEFAMDSSSEASSSPHILHTPGDLRTLFGAESEGRLYGNSFIDPHIRAENPVEASPVSDIGYPMPDPEEDGEDTSDEETGDYEYMHSGFGVAVPKTPKMRGPFSKAKMYATVAVGVVAAVALGRTVMDNVRTPNLEAERVPISQGINEAPEQEVIAPVVQAPTVEPTPTLAPTEIPDPEVTFEQLALMDASIGSFVQNEEGNLIYNSPLYNTEVGKNIPVVQQYREVGLDGGREVWIAPEKYPNAPIVVQDLDTGEIRQGPFRYDNDVRRRLTMPSSGQLYNSDITKGMEGELVALSALKTGEVAGHKIFLVTMFPTTSGLVERDDHLVLPVRSYIGDEDDMLAYYYDLSLGPIGDNNRYYNPWYNFYDNGRESIGSVDHILEPARQEAYARRFDLLGMQIAVTGYYDMASRDSIPQNTYASNFYYAEDNAAESRALLSILKSGGIGEIENDLDYNSLSLYGGIHIVVR